NQLIAFDLLRRKAIGSIGAPDGVEEAFEPQRSVLAASAPVLFTLGRASGGGLTLVRTDLETLTATAIQSVAGPPETGLTLSASPDGTRAYVYFPSGPARGYQPPTTSDERQINAMGVVDRFVPDQRA